MAFPTHTSVASEYLPRERVVQYIGRILFCITLVNLLHAVVYMKIVLISCHVSGYVMLQCCEQIGKSWGKDSKLLCGICLFRLSQGWNFHQLFSNSKEFQRLLLHWCLLLLAFMVGKNCKCSNPHSAWGYLLAWSFGPTGSQGRSVTCLVVWLLVSHTTVQKCWLPLQLVNLFEFKCVLPFLVLTDSSGGIFAVATSGTTATCQ